MMFNRILGACALALVFLSQTSPLSATPLTWTLSGATFYDGGTLSGSFVYDADRTFVGETGLITSGSFTTTNGTISLGQQYSLGLSFLSGNNIYAYDYFPNNIDESIGIFLTAKPTNAGGTIPISFAFERRDDNTNGQQGIFFVSADAAHAGVITATAGSSVPEPSGLALLGMGLVGLGLLRRRSSRLRSLTIG